MDRDALELDRLAGAVERAVGEEDGLLAAVIDVVGGGRVPLARAGELLLLVRDQDQVNPVVGGGHQVQPVLVGGAGLAGGEAAVVVAGPRLHLRALDRRPGAVVRDHPGHPRLAVIVPGDDGEVRHPEVGVVDAVAGRAEVLRVADDQVVEAGLQPGGRGDHFRPRLVVVGGGQVVGERHHRLLAEQRLRLGLGEVLRAPLGRLQPLDVVRTHDAEVRLRDVLVGHLDGRQRVGPHALGGGVRRLALDLLHEVEAQLAAGTVGECLHSGEHDFAGLEEVAFALHDAGQLVAGHREQFVPVVGRCERSQRGLVLRVLRLADRLVPPEPQAVQVGVQQRALVRVVLVEVEEFLVERERLDRLVARVGGLHVPREELLTAVEDRRVGWQFIGVLRLGPGLLGGRVEAERVEREDVEQRGPVRVRDGALFEQRVVLRDRRGLQFLLGGERLVERLVDLREDARQVPGLDVGAGCLAGRGALGEPPAVLLEVVPVPVCEDRVHHRVHFGRGGGDGRLHPRDFLLRLVTFDGPFQVNLLGDGLDRLRVRLVLDGRFDDRVEVVDGGLGQPLGDGLVDLLPLLLAGRLRGVSGGQHECDAGGDERERQPDGGEAVRPFHWCGPTGSGRERREDALVRCRRARVYSGLVANRRRDPPPAPSLEGALVSTPCW